LTGILNGVDPNIWSPENDALLPRPYGIDDAPAGKADAKQLLQRRLALDETPDRPLFGAVTRLSPQKGFDLLLAALPEFIAEGCRLVVLGSGDANLESGFTAAAASYPGQVGIVLGYDEALSHLIMAGADVILVPSRFEPCGLTQLYALRYGALPVVRRTGGLADTVVDANAVTSAEGSAVLFDEETPKHARGASALLRSMRRASWRRVVRQAMSCDFSWGAAARRYKALYTRLTTNTSAAQHRRLA
jgi:starch synthase